MIFLFTFACVKASSFEDWSPMRSAFPSLETLLQGVAVNEQPTEFDAPSPLSPTADVFNMPEAVTAPTVHAPRRRRGRNSPAGAGRGENSARHTVTSRSRNPPGPTPLRTNPEVPARPSPVRTDPVSPTPSRPTPARTDPVPPTPSRPTPARTDPVSPTPSRPSPVQTDLLSPGRVSPTLSWDALRSIRSAEQVNSDIEAASSLEEIEKVKKSLSALMANLADLRAAAAFSSEAVGHLRRIDKLPEIVQVKEEQLTRAEKKRRDQQREHASEKITEEVRMTISQLDQLSKVSSNRKTRKAFDSVFQQLLALQERVSPMVTRGEVNAGISKFIATNIAFIQDRLVELSQPDVSAKQSLDPATVLIERSLEIAEDVPLRIQSMVEAREICEFEEMLVSFQGELLQFDDKKTSRSNRSALKGASDRIQKSIACVRLLQKQVQEAADAMYDTVCRLDRFEDGAAKIDWSKKLDVSSFESEVASWSFFSRNTRIASTVNIPAAFEGLGDLLAKWRKISFEDIYDIHEIGYEELLAQERFFFNWTADELEVGAALPIRELATAMVAIEASRVSLKKLIRVFKDTEVVSEFERILVAYDGMAFDADEIYKKVVPSPRI